MDFTQQHVASFENRQRIAKNNIERGMIIYGSYTDRKGKVKQRVFLILHELYLQKVHVLSLSAIAPMKFIALARQTNLLYLLEPRYKSLMIEKLQLSTGQTFYNSVLRAQLKSNLKGSYRTLDVAKLKNLFLIDYKFPKDIKILNESEFKNE